MFGESQSLNLYGQIALVSRDCPKVKNMNRILNYLVVSFGSLIAGFIIAFIILPSQEIILKEPVNGFNKKEYKEVIKEVIKEVKIPTPIYINNDKLISELRQEIQRLNAELLRDNAND